MNTLTYIALTIAIICAVSQAQNGRLRKGARGTLGRGRQLSAADKRVLNREARINGQRRKGTVSIRQSILTDEFEILVN